MGFVLALTAREIRSSFRRLIFFFLCIALGVCAIVALRSLIQNVMLAVASDARALMTADVELNSTSDFTPTEIAAIEKAAASAGIVEARTETLTSSAMARPVNNANAAAEMVELKGVENNFPLVGDFTLSDGARFDASLLSDNGAVAARILTDDLGIKIGDKIRIGEGEFTLKAVFDEEPGGTGGFRLGARVFVAKDAFDTTGITRNTSRVRRYLLFRTSSEPSPFVAALREAVKGTNISVRSYKETQERMERQFERTENYLSLTGLLMLVLGGIGVWNVARAFVDQKRLAVAVLKCLGARAGTIIFVYLLQIAVLGLLGSIFGAVLAQGALWLAGYYFADALPTKMTYSVGVGTAAEGIALGIAISLIFSALPLLGIRTIKPKLLLRDANNTRLRRLDPIRLAVGGGGLALLLSAAVWQAGSVAVGISFLGGLIATAAALYCSAVLLTKLLSRLRGLTNLSLRQAINSLYRPGNQTRIILLAVGLGTFVIVSVQAIERNLIRELDVSGNARLPSMFFIDIQKSQLGELSTLIEQSTGEKAEQTPTVRARISFINGKPADFSETQVRREEGIIGREFAVTYRAKLDANETLAAGDWWITTRPSDVPEVSVEEGMAERLRIGLGDSITFDISGRPFTARVANVRRIDLRNTRTAFVFVFRPGFLENAPQSFAATILKKIGATQRQKLQRDITEKFPNVQIFDVADIIEAVRNIVGNFVLALSFVGGFVILTGVLILIGSVALTRSQRVYENAVMKTLGAKTPLLGKMLAAEYGVLGLLAGFIGSAFAMMLSYAVCRFVLEISWKSDVWLFAAGVIATMLVVTAVGVTASYGVLFKKPLSILRGG